MDNRRLFRSIVALVAGCALCSILVLAISSPVPVAAAPVTAPSDSHTQEYTGNLQFNGALEINYDMLEGDMWVTQLGPLKQQVTWTCDQGICGYTGRIGWQFAANGATADNMVVCTTGEYPWNWWTDCDTPPQTIESISCSSPDWEAGADCFSFGNFPRYWSDVYGMYCYDVDIQLPYPAWIQWKEWLKVCSNGMHVWNVTVVEVNGIKTTQPSTECVEVESVNLTGPVTATKGVATPYELTWSTSEPAEVEFNIGVDALGVAEGPLWSETDDNYREFFMRWLVTGTHTVTAQVSTLCSYGTDFVTTEITDSAPFTNVIPLFPIGDCNWYEGFCYVECNCPLGDHSWDIGGWIEWLVCRLICLVEALFRRIWWVFLWFLNQLITVFNYVLILNSFQIADIIHWIEYYQFVWSNFIAQTLANLGKFLSDHILTARNWIYAGLTWFAEQFETGSDLLGDNVEAWFTELGEWTRTNLTEFGETANESITNWGASRAADVENFRDWSYEGLLELAAYFSGWGTGMGDFLALVITAIANFLYDVLTIYADFTRNLYDQLGNLVEALLLWAGQMAYIILITIGKMLNGLITGFGLFIATYIRLFRDQLYDWMTILAYAVDAFFGGLGRFLAMVINVVADFIKLVILTFNAIMIGLSMLAQLAVELITLAVDFLVQVYEAVIWLSQLALGLLNAFVSGLQSDTVPEMYTDAEGLYYFWRGLAFFESIAESSPLAIVNTIAIGLIGINLLFWTLRQVMATLSDIKFA